MAQRGDNLLGKDRRMLGLFGKVTGDGKKGTGDTGLGGERNEML